MAKYEVLTRSFINNSLVEEGTIIDIVNTDPSKGGVKPGTNLRLVKEAKKNEAKAEQNLDKTDAEKELTDNSIDSFQPDSIV